MSTTPQVLADKMPVNGKNYIHFRIFCRTMSYRQLQTLAKKLGIPCNMKKDMLRDILDAKLRGDLEQVEVLLHQVRDSRQMRKRERELENQLKTLTEEEKQQINLQSINLIKIKQEEEISKDIIKHVPVKIFNPHRLFNGGGIVKKVEKKHSRKVTVCRTQMHTQYRIVNPANHVGYSAVNPSSGYSSVNPTSGYSSVNPNSGYSAVNPSSGYSAVNSGSGFTHYNPHAQAFSHNSAPVWQGASLIDQRYSIPSSTAALPSLQGPFPPLQDFMSSFQMLGAQQLDPPPLLCPHPYNRFVYPVTQGPEEPLRFQEGSAYRYPGEVDHSYSNEPDSTQSQLPPLEIMTAPMRSQGNFTYNSEQSLQQPQGQVETEVNSTALECLADTAITMSESETPKRQDRPMIGEAPKQIYPQNDDSSELIVGSSKPTPKNDEILTWNHFLEKISSKDSTSVSCMFGCRQAFDNRQNQAYHETHCFFQMIQCPAPACSWVNQLGSLDTHVFNIHNLEVIRSGEASFSLNFSNTMNYFAPTDSEGPKRLCFFQLVDHRIFVISVIYNYQKMQIYVYIQFVNDHLDMLSAAALEVGRVDGVPYQWKGRVFPISYRAMHLITQRRCLIFNIGSANNFATHLTLHTKIHNHKIKVLP